MAKLPMPDVPPGNLRALVEALHDLHARAGWPGTRPLSRGRDFSHTAVHDLFTKTTTTVPRLTVLLDVVERLASMNRRLNVEETVDRFDSLWEAARADPFLTDQIGVGTIAAELLAEMADGKSESEAAEAIKTPYRVVEEIIRPQVLALYNVRDLEEALRERRRRGIREVSTNRMLELIAEGKTEAEVERILDWPPGIFEERRRTLIQLYDVNSLEEVIAEDRRLNLQTKARQSAAADASSKNESIGPPSTAQANPDSRLDLMALSPAEFEDFVRKLLEARGLKNWEIKPGQQDDGIDAVMVNRDPLVGGLTIVQAKRFSNVVGVNQILQLVGLMNETQAGRGVLITTSWFNKRSWEKAEANGRIELIDGPRLQQLARETLGIDVVVAIRTLSTNKRSTGDGITRRRGVDRRWPGWGQSPDVSP